MRFRNAFTGWCLHDRTSKSRLRCLDLMPTSADHEPLTRPKIMNHLTKPNGDRVYSKPPFLALAALTLGVALFCSGCLTSKSYVDPQFRDATYASITGGESPRPVNISVEFQFNGQRRDHKQT